MLLAVRISSYGCTWEVWRALKKLELFRIFRALQHFRVHPGIIRFTHSKHEQILQLLISTDWVKCTTVKCLRRLLKRWLRLILLWVSRLDFHGWKYLTINERGWVSYEELHVRRSRRIKPYFYFLLLALPWRIQRKNTEDMQTLVIRT